MIDVTRIKEGMTVYNKSGDKIGTVDYVQFGDEDPNKTGVETVTAMNTAYDNTTNIVKSLADILVNEGDHIPQELRDRLNRSGYIRLNSSGFFESDYYIPLNTVTGVMGENIHIGTTKDELIAI